MDDKKTKNPEPKKFDLKFDLKAFLGGHAGTVMAGPDLRKALEAAGDSDPVKTMAATLDTGQVKSLGNDHGKDGEPGKVYRFKIPEAKPGGEFWVRLAKGYGSEITVGSESFDAFGRKVELSAEKRAEYEHRATPLEVITDPKKIAELEAEAEERKAKAAGVRDKKAETLAAFG